jgi:acetyl/propionyl-CoA carboxylase alpha subunit/acetyl-CoA carboxylase carboxyltransferase component
MGNDFQRVAIVNRGEAAMRFIHAVREFNDEQGTSLRTIALFTEPDRRAMFVREADEAVCLGAAHSIDSATRQSKSTYVDYDQLARAMAAAHADAVWVGWGFVAEHAAFADLCREMGIVFIGPDGDVMRRLGDKISSKLLAEEEHIPIAPWSFGPVETLDDAKNHAEQLGYPVLIKATAGGGGHGIRRVNSPAQLPRAFESARAEAHKAFGDPTVFMEQLIPHARHVEVQIIADHYGTTWAVGVRDCTIQRRHQKILEEAPSPALSLELDQALRDAAVRLSRAAGYHNAGTVEFLYQPECHRFVFMEMNTRLQVEHPVTECTTGLDLVKLQIYIARGGHLEGEPPRTTGHAIEVRLNAEDPDNGFAPAPGTIERLRIQAGPGVRIDTGVAEGDVVPPEFDSMIAKIIAYGQTRAEALSRLQRAIRESVVVIKGGVSNKSLLLELLSRPEVRQGKVDVGWMERLVANNDLLSRDHADVALLQAAIASYDAELAVEQTQFYASALRGRPQVRSDVGRIVALRYRGQPYRLRVSRIGIHQYCVETDGATVDVQRSRLGQFEYWLTCFGRRYNVVSVVQGLSFLIEVDGITHRINRDDGGMVHAPAPAVVVSLAVKPGDTVSTGGRLAVLEAMKMEMQVVAPFSGIVREVLTAPNVQVNTGTPLVRLELLGTGDATTEAERVAFKPSFVSAESGGDAGSACLRNLGKLRQLMLGFDVDPTHISRLLATWSHSREETGDGHEIAQCEDEILKIFVDIAHLFHREPKFDDPTTGEAPTSEAYLFSYLRMLDTRGDRLPPSFMDALHRALAHYGVETLERSPELEESLLWIYKSHQRTEQQVSLIVGVLEQRLTHVETFRTQVEDSFKTLLDRIISLTRGSFPAISDLARELRYRCFDQPVFEKARKQVYAQVEESLAYLTARPQADDRQERIRALVECPQPLVRFAGRFATGQLDMRQLMLEVITRRYYRIQTLLDVRSYEVNNQPCVSAEYQENGKRVRLFTIQAELPRLLESARAMFPLIEQVPADEDVVIDFYIWQPVALSDSDAVQMEVCSMLNQTNFPRPIRYVALVISGPGRGDGMGAVRHLTFRQGEKGYEEDRLYDGLHPMMGRRLHLQRFSNFRLERLPSVEDIYLFHAVAHENPKDERLFALAEVRDLTPECDESGRILQLPHLERMFAEALAGIRLYQSRRPVRDRLYWNRILMYVWPPLRVKPDEFHNIVHRLAPATDGLGLEQVVLRARIPNPETGDLRDMVIRISRPAGAGLLITFRPAGKLLPIKPLTEYDQKVLRMRQRGLTYPYEIIELLTPSPEDTRAEFPPGEFVEYDLDSNNRLVPVTRPYGQNKANIIVGIIRNFTARYPEGMTRVLLMGDPSKELGALAEPECRRIIAALDLAEEEGIPLEWFPISAGAKISMESGVENMDWIACVLRRVVQFTQAGGEVNLVINGVNVGAQPYWNAEATMLMHTRGILVMTPQSSMVLTGKRALDYSGSVSAENNEGIGGYDRIMGLNGQAQYWAKNIDEACRILFRHYEHTYVAPGEHSPRRAMTTDPFDRDVRAYPHTKTRGDGFSQVGEIFSNETNPGRKKSFDIRSVMMAAVDQDHHPLERWSGMRGAETAVVWDAHLGGYPICLIGIESRPVPRLGYVPADGPDQWYAGTLFPLASKKVARAINAASSNRPVVILANLSGFDGSPESMRKLQLEYGAEIGRAVVNFKGPMVFCVISRYHGGAYVVFSRMLNEQLQVAALEGTFASVIGGAPAAAVVFSGEVEARTRKDPRLQALSEALATADSADKRRLRNDWDELFKAVHSEKLGEIAAEFDRVHSVHRALEVGALQNILPPANLRPYLIGALERGLGVKDTESMEHENPILKAKAAVASF